MVWQTFPSLNLQGVESAGPAGERVTVSKDSSLADIVHAALRGCGTEGVWPSKSTLTVTICFS